MGGRSICGAAVVAAFLLASSPARAEDPSRVAAATLLFDEGVRALDAGRLEEACAKLAKSQELAPSGGTLLALAECHERSGHFASAFVAFRGAAARAAAAGKSDAEASALEQAARLEPKLARITINVSTPTQNLELQRDGIAVSASEHSVPIPVDPGNHEIRASAPGMRGWSKTVQVDAGGQATVDVPPLVAPPVERPPEDDTGSTQRSLGIVAAGLGGAALITSMVFGVLANSANSDGEALCKGRSCTREGLDAIDDASSKAAVSTVFFATGLTLIAGGAALYLTAPQPVRRGAFLDWRSATLRW